MTGDSVSFWNEEAKFADYLLERIKPVDVAIVSILSGENESEYFRVYRLIQTLYLLIRPISVKMETKKKLRERLDFIFKDLPKKIYEFSRMMPSTQKDKIKSEIVEYFTEIYAGLWEILIASQIFVKLIPDFQNLTREEIFAGVVVLPEESKNGNENNSS